MSEAVVLTLVLIFTVTYAVAIIRCDRKSQRLWKRDMEELRRWRGGGPPM